MTAQLRIASWNVNSLRVRLPQLISWLEACGPDVVGLQETKLTDDVFPHEELRALGYHAAASGQKTYNGVALEREALQGLLELGLADTFRLFEQPPAAFSWWDYRQGGFRRNQGLRIDLVLASQALAGRCEAASIDTEPRRAERPSDHAPVMAGFGR